MSVCASRNRGSHLIVDSVARVAYPEFGTILALAHAPTVLALAHDGCAVAARASHLDRCASESPGLSVVRQDTMQNTGPPPGGLIAGERVPIPRRECARLK